MDKSTPGVVLSLVLILAGLVLFVVPVLPKGLPGQPNPNGSDQNLFALENLGIRWGDRRISLNVKNAGNLTGTLTTLSIRSFVDNPADVTTQSNLPITLKSGENATVTCTYQYTGGAYYMFTFNNNYTLSETAPQPPFAVTADFDTTNASSILLSCWLSGTDARITAVEVDGEAATVNPSPPLNVTEGTETKLNLTLAYVFGHNYTFTIRYVGPYGEEHVETVSAVAPAPPKIFVGLDEWGADSLSFQAESSGGPSTLTVLTINGTDYSASAGLPLRVLGGETPRLNVTIPYEYLTSYEVTVISAFANDTAVFTSPVAPTMLAYISDWNDTGALNGAVLALEAGGEPVTVTGLSVNGTEATFNATFPLVLKANGRVYISAAFSAEYSTEYAFTVEYSRTNLTLTEVSPDPPELTVYISEWIETGTTGAVLRLETRSRPAIVTSINVNGTTVALNTSLPLTIPAYAAKLVSASFALEYSADYNFTVTYSGAGLAFIETAPAPPDLVLSLAEWTDTGAILRLEARGRPAMVTGLTVNGTAVPLNATLPLTIPAYGTRFVAVGFDLEYSAEYEFTVTYSQTSTSITETSPLPPDIELGYAEWGIDWLSIPVTCTGGHTTLLHVYADGADLTANSILPVKLEQDQTFYLNITAFPYAYDRAYTIRVEHAWGNASATATSPSAPNLDFISTEWDADGVTLWLTTSSQPVRAWKILVDGNDLTANSNLPQEAEAWGNLYINLALTYVPGKEYTVSVSYCRTSVTFTITAPETLTGSGGGG
jgi:hypothetical protein